MASVNKIISGAQTGADRAALDFAIAHGIPHGGYVPKNRKAEDGVIPAKYAVTETRTTSYPYRTRLNVKESDGTVIFTNGPLAEESGCALTLRLCRELKKPHMVVDLTLAVHSEAALMLLRFVIEAKIETLNVAGSRESKAPGIHQKVLTLLELAFAGR